LRGIVTQDTKTKAGNDFYNFFSIDYRNSGLNSNKIIAIKELFNFGRNTKIQIMVEMEIVYQFFIQPKEEYLKSMSTQSLRSVSAYLQQLIKNQETIQKY
jgi:predicted AlkP superfamily pyrophosphatase or phosphodiesterase